MIFDVRPACGMMAVPNEGDGNLSGLRITKHFSPLEFMKLRGSIANNDQTSLFPLELMKFLFKGLMMTNICLP